MLRRALGILTAITASGVPAAGQAPITIGTYELTPTAGPGFFGAINGIAVQTIVAPDGVANLTGFGMAFENAEMVEEGSLEGFWWEMFVVELDQSTDRGEFSGDGFCGLSCFDRPPGVEVYRSAQAYAGFFSERSWFSVGGLGVPVQSGRQYALGITTSQGPDNSNYYEVRPSLVSDDSYEEGFGAYCGPCGGFGGDMLFRADFVAVPEPGTLALLLTGMLGLGFVAWRRRETLADRRVDSVEGSVGLVLMLADHVGGIGELYSRKTTWEENEEGIGNPNGLRERGAS